MKMGIDMILLALMWIISSNFQRNTKYPCQLTDTGSNYIWEEAPQSSLFQSVTRKNKVDDISYF